MDSLTPKERFDVWQALVGHIVYKVFGPTCLQTMENGGWYRRPFEREDLLQVGYLRLYEVCLEWDPHAKHKVLFATFAYNAVCNALIDYINQNSSVIRLPRTRDRRRLGSEKLRLYQEAAQRCRCFSEYGLKSQDSYEWRFLAMMSRETPPEEKVAKNDYLQAMMGRLKAGLGEKQYNLLYRWAAGDTAAELAAERGCKPRSVVHQLTRLRARARKILEEYDQADHNAGD